MRGRRTKAIRRFMEDQRHLTSLEATNLYRKLKGPMKDELEFAVISGKLTVVSPKKVFSLKKGIKTYVFFQ